MRRKDREVAGMAELLEIIHKCKVCRLGLVDGQRPYVVPMNFGAQLEEGVIAVYLHCAGEGQRLDILRRNPAACVEFDCGHQLLEGDIACAHSYAYESVIGFGQAEILEGHQEKAAGLAAIHRNVTGKEFDFTPEQTGFVTVIRIRLGEVTGKRREPN